MAASVVVLLATIYVFGLVPKGFIPSEDIGQIIVNTEGAQGVSFEQMVQYQQQIAALVGKDGNVESYFSSVGVGGAIGAWLGGYLFDVTRSYMAPFSISFACLIVSIFVVWMSTRNIRRQNYTEGMRA